MIVFACAQRGLRAGEILDGIGGYCCYGLIENRPEESLADGLPICLSEGVVLKRDIAVDRPPLISIIIATYNRSNVLAVAIESVLSQTLDDWEAIVVGDACTDDTEDVVRSFDDPRIRFLNLAENCGEQSGPNNHGMGLARGRYIAFLNHDDIWLPDHLEVCREGLEAAEADLVFTNWCADAGGGVRRIKGHFIDGRYDPMYPQIIPAAWFFRRELAQEIGPWCSPRETTLLPSQQWLFRVWKKRKIMRSMPRVTLVHLPARRRPTGYADRESVEQRSYLSRISEDPARFRRELPDADPIRPERRRLWHSVALFLGVHPRAVRAFLDGKTPKRVEETYRRRRGLPRKPR